MSSSPTTFAAAYGARIGAVPRCRASRLVRDDGERADSRLKQPSRINQKARIKQQGQTDQQGA
jgi:hypothetical protein